MSCSGDRPTRKPPEVKVCLFYSSNRHHLTIRSSPLPPCSNRIPSKTKPSSSEACYTPPPSLPRLDQRCPLRAGLPLSSLQRRGNVSPVPFCQFAFYWFLQASNASLISPGLTYDNLPFPGIANVPPGRDSDAYFNSASENYPSGR